MSSANTELVAIGAALDSAGQDDALIKLGPLLDGFTPDLFTDELRADAMRAILEAVKTGNPATPVIAKAYMTVGADTEREEVLLAALRAYAEDNDKLSGAPGYYEMLVRAKQSRTGIPQQSAADGGKSRRVTVNNGNIIPSSPPPMLHAISATDLIALDIQPIQWIVPNILPEGLSVLAGREKMGKSFLALQLAHAVATGGEFLGQKCRQGAALYLDLESGQRRPRDRLLKMFGNNISSNLFFLTGLDDVRQVDNGLVLQLQDQLQQHPNICLIIIDVLQIIKPAGKRGLNAYEADYATFGELRKFISQHPGLSLLVITHLNKGGEITGSTANRGAMDAILQLSREAGASNNQGVLKIEGRDFEQGTQELSLEWTVQPPKWIYRGSVADREAAQRARLYAASPIIQTIRKGLTMNNGEYKATAAEMIRSSVYWGTAIHCDYRKVGKEVDFFADMLQADGVLVTQSSGGRSGRGYVFTDTRASCSSCSTCS